ncbi:MAG TPA: EamA family transporter RarD [Anaerolineales bacterium]|nr:EamA family transporter RarD [Anaerolineales bacterium]
MNKGILNGIAAYVLWGFFPIYWKLLHQVPALQVIGHRISWSFLMLIAFILLTKQWKGFRTVAFSPKTLGIYTIAAVLLSINWLIYVWGVNSGFIVETSLGYFINPLISVLLGVIFLRERLRPAQWIPVGLAAAGVIYLTVAYGRLPWIALSLAFVGFTGMGAFLHEGALTDILLIGAGGVTTIPLLMFASAARQIPLTVVGLLQYIAPTLQFLIGVFIYKEPFDHSHLIGFGIVWIALIIFWVENFLAHRVPVEPIPEMGEG